MLFNSRRFSSLPSPSEASKLSKPAVANPIGANNPRKRGFPVDPRTRRFFLAIGIAAAVLQISISVGVIMAINNPSEE